MLFCILPFVFPHGFSSKRKTAPSASQDNFDDDLNLCVQDYAILGIPFDRYPVLDSLGIPIYPQAEKYPTPGPYHPTSTIMYPF